MRTNTLVLAAVLSSLGLAAPAAAVDEPENVIKYRQAVMQSMGAHATAIVRVVKGEVSFVAHVADHADGVNRMSKLIPDLFPAGTGNDAFADTRALPEIWKDRAKFDQAARTLQGASTKLLEVAASGDMAAIGAQLESLGQACGGCHKPFRAEKK